MNNNIKLDKQEFIAKITLSKPPLNILNIDDLNYLSKVLGELNNQEKLKLIIIDSNQKVFSAGIDVSDHKKDKAVELLTAFHGVFYQLVSLKIPTLAVVNSGCYGGGFELALFCDFIIASDKADFSLPEIKLGCYPPVALAVLSSLIGNKKALELILTGNKINAENALKFGLINHLFKEDEIDQKTEEFINSIVSNSSSVIKTTVNAFKKINQSDLKEKLYISEKIYIEELIKLEDSEEGIKSFLEKRKPIWNEK